MRAPATVSAHLIFSSVPRSGIYLSAAGSPLVPAPLGSESTPSRPRCTRYSTVTANVLHTMLHPRKMKAQSKEKIFCRGRATKQQISTPRQTSSVSYICGHRLLHIRRHAGESETRARPRKPNSSRRGRVKKTTNGTSRQTSSATYICGHRLIHIVRKAGESRNTRSPKETKNFLSRPNEKNRDLNFKANLFGNLYMRLQAYSHCEKSR